MLRIGMLTSGGDCQALNAAMRGVVKGLFSKRDDVEIYGFQDGYKGLIYSNFKMLMFWKVLHLDFVILWKLQEVLESRLNAQRSAGVEQRVHYGKRSLQM